MTCQVLDKKAKPQKRELPSGAGVVEVPNTAALLQTSTKSREVANSVPETDISSASLPSVDSSQVKTESK